MKLVYSAAHMVDAQLVLDELQAGGLMARISGSYLSGAIGELPPDSLIKVWIESSLQYDRARAIIDEFEASRAATGPDVPCPGCGEMHGPQFGRCWQCDAWLVRT